MPVHQQLYGGNPSPLMSPMLGCFCLNFIELSYENPILPRHSIEWPSQCVPSFSLYFQFYHDCFICFPNLYATICFPIVFPSFFSDFLFLPVFFSLFAIFSQFHSLPPNIKHPRNHVWVSLVGHRMRMFIRWMKFLILPIFPWISPKLRTLLRPQADFVFRDTAELSLEDFVETVLQFRGQSPATVKAPFTAGWANGNNYCRYIGNILLKSKGLS